MINTTFGGVAAHAEPAESTTIISIRNRSIRAP
jgi:hypothetical protein